MLRFQKSANIHIAYKMAVLSAEYVAVCCKDVAGIFDYGNTADEFKHHDKVYWEQVHITAKHCCRVGFLARQPNKLLMLN